MTIKVTAALALLLLVQMSPLPSRAEPAVNGTTFELTTEPEGASVFVDNQPVGRSPIRLAGQLEPGTHSLRVELQGYKTVTRDFPISSVLRLNLRLTNLAGTPEPTPAPAPAPKPPKKPSKVPPRGASAGKPPRPDSKLPDAVKNPTPTVIETPSPEAVAEPPRMLEKGVESWDPNELNLYFGLWTGYQTKTLAAAPGASFLNLKASIEARPMAWLGVQLSLGMDFNPVSSWGDTLSGFEGELGVPLYFFRTGRHAFFGMPQIGGHRHSYSVVVNPSSLVSSASKNSGRQARFGASLGYLYLPASSDGSSIGFSAKFGAVSTTDLDTVAGATSLFGDLGVIFAF